MYIHAIQDGTKTVVDAEGKPVDSPPLYTMIVNEKGEQFYLAHDPTSIGETEIKGVLTSYSAPITGMYVNVSKDGITVVDANGKPVDSPPLIRQFVEKGEVVYDAYYPGSQGGTTLEYYKPPSDNHHRDVYTWTGHYEVSLERTPFLYYIDWFYSIFTPMILWICGIYVALQIIRLIVDRARRSLR